MTPPPPGNRNGLDRVVLGDNQFFAVNHMSQERSFAQAERFATDEAILGVMATARDLGVRSMMLHSHPRAEALCDELRKDTAGWNGFGLYPCIPYAFKYVMALNEQGFYPVLRDQVKKAGVGTSLSLFLKGGVGLARGDYHRLIEVLVDLELHNVVVDLLLALEIDGMLRMYADHVRSKGLRPGFGTLNLPRLVDRLRAERVEDAVIMTAVNPIGFFMNPSREACEIVLQDAGLQVMAMSILASGSVPASRAFPYAASFPAVKSFLFGASRRQTLEASLNLLGHPAPSLSQPGPA